MNHKAIERRQKEVHSNH